MATSSAFTPQFDEPAFRQGILGAMQMGMPEDPAEQLTWVWDREVTFSPDDPAGNPYDWTSVPVTDVPGNPALGDPGPPGPQTKIVPYALEFAPGSGDTATTLGQFDTSKATVTLMDVDHVQVQTADYAILGDTRYRIRFDSPAQGLFGVTVHQVFLEALEES